jgi:bacteriorhodopsin
VRALRVPRVRPARAPPERASPHPITRPYPPSALPAPRCPSPPPSHPLQAGASYTDISWVVLCDLLMIAAGFAGAVSAGQNAVWPLFTFGMVAFLPILYALLVTFPATAAARGPKTAALFRTLSLIMAVTWTAYPLIWATGEGGRVASVDQETIAYAVFDITAKVVFGAILVSGHAAVANEGVAPPEYEGLLQGQGGGH